MEKAFFVALAIMMAVCANAAAPALYFLIGLDGNWSTPQEKYQLARNQEALDQEGINEFFIKIDLKTTDQFKVIEAKEDWSGVQKWFPDPSDNFGQKGEIKKDGNYTVYFRPDYNGSDDWFCNCIRIEENSETAIDAVVGANAKSVKIMQNGKMYILHNGKRYDANGIEIK